MIMRSTFFFQRRVFFGVHVHGKLYNAFIILIFISSLTGCVSAKYEMAGESASPPVPLNLRAEAHSVEAEINTVIILGGPGSWKREAYWDEYILSITNRGDHPVDLTTATLIDFQGNPVMSGDNPWELQEQSKAWVENYNSGTSGIIIKVGATSLIAGAVFGGAVASAASSIGFAVTLAVMVPVVLVASVVMSPIIGVGTVIRNVNHKHSIEDEFKRRRLVLPATIRPEQITQGSLFFRITPGPKQVTLRFTGVEPGFDVSVDLTPLSGLHIEKMPKSTKAE